MAITTKELIVLGIKSDDECLYCGYKDSIEHTFIECLFIRSFAKKLLFGITPGTKGTKIIIIVRALTWTNSSINYLLSTI